MGVHVSMSGEAVRQVASEWGLFTERAWRDWLSTWHFMGVKWTRVDVALDDAGPNAILDIGVIYAESCARNLVTPFHDFERLNKEKRSLHGEDKGVATGDTLYYGSRKSNMFIRIYDKAAQLGLESYKWVRVEGECKREQAVAMVDMIIRVGFVCIPQVIKFMLDFKVPSESDSNKSRWVTADWWEDFLGACEKARLLVSKVVSRSIETVRHWLDKQAAQSLALVVDAIRVDCRTTGADSRREIKRFLYSLVDNGRSRYKSKHRIMLGSYAPLPPAVSWSGGLI
jgi:phage replication initiation protein